MSVIFEPPAEINRRLAERFGKTEDKPNFRIVFSEDEYEYRQTDKTPEGFDLIHPEVKLLPKYKQWIQQKYILERLTVVPVFQQKVLPEQVMSYEPIFVFEDKNGSPLRPAWAVCELCIDSIHKAIQDAGLYTKYAKDEFDGLTPEQSIEKKRDRINDLVEAMWPNESPVGDALATENAISMAGLDGQKAVRSE